MRRALSLALLLLIAPICAMSVARSGQLSPIPDEAPTALGPIPIHRVPHLQCKGGPAYGCFHRETWVIEIRADSISLLQAWQSLEHELFHADMQVAGIEFDNPADEDHIAEGAAQGQVLRMRAGWPH